MATLTLLEKARHGRNAALASLATRGERTDNVVSIFDYAFHSSRAPAPQPAEHRPLRLVA